MGAWIKIGKNHVEGAKLEGRTPRWVRGLKLEPARDISTADEVAPHDGCVD